MEKREQVKKLADRAAEHLQGARYAEAVDDASHGPSLRRSAPSA